MAENAMAYVYVRSGVLLKQGAKAALGEGVKWWLCGLEASDKRVHTIHMDGDFQDDGLFAPSTSKPKGGKASMFGVPLLNDDVR